MRVETRMTQVMSEVFGVPQAELGEGASPDTVAQWDSLHHMSLLLALEQEFGVTFPDADLPALTSFAAIRAALGEVGAGAAPCS